MTSQRARETLELMLGHLGLVFEVEEMEPAGRHVLNVHSREAGRLIGRDGQVLEDLQYLLNRILNRGEEGVANVIVDIEGYRQKEKQDFLGRIRELADQVRQTGKPIALAPMNSFDRRLVHQAFADDPEIATHSEESTARLKQITLSPCAPPAAPKIPHTILSKKALITGITGQDGSYLAELLLGKGYEVHGVIRRSSSFNTERIDHLYQDRHVTGVKLFLHYGDLSDSASLMKLLHDLQPDEIYHLGAQSHVRVSFDVPEYTGDVTGLGTTRLLEAIRETTPKARFYQASSSEMYGLVQAVPQREDTPFYPRSPYGAAKVYGYWMTVNYRESYQLHASNGILFNHESPRRGETFVTRKITRALSRIKAGLQKEIYLGNLEARRDWGYAPEYVEAMWLMLQQEQGGDYVVATGETHSVQEFLEEAFRCANLDWKDYVKIDPRYYRPAEVDLLIGDAAKAKKVLGWQPKTTFAQLVKIMVEADDELLKKQLSGQHLRS